MAMINTLKKFLEEKGVTTSYRFAKDVGIPQSTALRLFNNPDAYPSKETQDAICKTYNAQPGDFLAYIPDDHRNAC